MPTYRITTGVSADHRVTFEVDGPAEIGPETIFEICNRVSTDVEDFSRIMSRLFAGLGYDLHTSMTRAEVTMMHFLAMCRVEMNEHHACSLSVGDSYTVISDAGERVVTYTCEPVGWSST